MSTVHVVCCLLVLALASASAVRSYRQGKCSGKMLAGIIALSIVGCIFALFTHDML